MKLRLLALLFVLTPMAAHAQFDINGSVFGQFANSVAGNGSTQNPQPAVGGMFGIRHYERPWRGYEINYAYTLPRVNFAGASVFTQQENSHYFTADYVVNFPVPIVGVRPFALAGAGAALFSPVAQGAGITNTEGLLCLGAGLDIRIVPHIGMRIQYRELNYPTPNYGNSGVAATGWTHAQQPMAGLYLQF